MGQKNEAIQILKTHCLDSLDDVIDLCRMFDVPEHELWDPLLEMANQDNSKMPQLLEYVESYKKPHRIFKAFNDHSTLDEMRQPLLKMFGRLDSLNNFLWRAAADSNKARSKASRHLQNGTRGFRNKKNKCYICGEDLIPRVRVTVGQLLELEKLKDKQGRKQRYQKE